MNKNIKKDLHDFTTNLNNKVGLMKLMGTDSSIVDLLERVSNIGSISILNYSELKPEEIERVVRVLKLGETFTSTDISHIDISKSDDLNTIVDSLETLFRNKRLLLDHQPGHTL